MDDYKPPYSISETMLNYVSSICTKLGKLEAYNNLDTKPHLRRNNRIKSVHASLKIEANSLTMEQIRDILDGKHVLGPKNEIQEVKNAYAAYALLAEVNPYNLADLKRVHGVMEHLLLQDAGTFRAGNEGVFSGDRCIFMAPPPDFVPALMQQLFSWMQNNHSKVHPLIMGAVFHYEFVFIHPFSDGNGRMARLWHTLLLAKWNPIFAYIPLESQIEKFQQDYYDAIAACHIDGTSDAFIEFMLARIDELLDAINTEVRTSHDMLTDYVRHLLDVMEYGVPYSAKNLLDLLGLKSRETFRKNYMHPALELGLIKRTLPDKPNSKNQRYIKL